MKKNSNKIVILNLIQDLQRLSLFLNNLRGRFRNKFGMTLCKHNAGFTLVELLVVVLIIGILAAVALPQYNKAVDKSRYMQAMLLGAKIAQAQQQYKLENDSYAKQFSELDINMPTPKNTRQEENLEYYNYDWGWCWITSTYDACLITLNSSDRAWYFKLRTAQKAECWAEPTDSKRPNELCKSVTKQQGTNGHYSF